MTKKLLLINPAQYPKNDKLTLASALRLQPASLGYLAALTPSNWKIKVIDENIEAPILEDADLVAISAYTPNIPRAYEIAGIFRQRGIKTVIGGVHASMLPNEAAQFVDCVVVGEAEPVWQHVIRDFENNGLKTFYKGRLESLENLVKPKRDIYSKKYAVDAYLQTARGCPNDCEFCSVSVLHGRKYRQRPVNEILDELESISSRNLFFTDDNVLGYGKEAEERAIRLFRGMLERGIDKRWVSQVGIDFAENPEVLRHAKKAGCLGVFVGFESIDEETLQDMHKARNLRMGVNNYKEIVKRIHDHGMAVVGAFVFGNDTDTKDVFDRTTEYILDAEIDGQQLSILTPLPGTRLYERMKAQGRLLRTNYPHDWKYYDFADVVFRPLHMTPDELLEGLDRIYKNTTSKLVSLSRALNTLGRTGSVFAPVVSYMWNRGYGTVWHRKYEYIKKTQPHIIEDSCSINATIRKDAGEGSIIEGSELSMRAGAWSAATEMGQEARENHQEEQNRIG